MCANLIYADNNAVFGIQQRKVDKCFQDLTTAVTDRHLPLHEIQKSSDRGDLLGVHIDGVAGLVRPTKTRLWRVRQAFQYLAGAPRVTGPEVLHIIGHAT